MLISFDYWLKIVRCSPKSNTFTLIETVKDMAAVDPSYMAPGHCSGWRAKAALENGFPGRVVSLGVGSDFFITSQSGEAK